jgi:uncharacterized protein
MSAPQRLRPLLLLCLLTAGQLLLPLSVQAQTPAPAVSAAPLVIGETFTLDSKVLGEKRQLNVYLPAAYTQSKTERLPVLYMPDGGLNEDFLHVAGLLQVSEGNGTMRPFILVGIANTERRRDLTGPTEVAADRKIAPRVGGSAAFRRFIRTELMPAIRTRYRTTEETAIVGESLAGLFVVETLLLEPDLFGTYLAFDPSLWWNGAYLVKQVPRLLQAQPARFAGKTLYLASSNEPQIVADTQQLNGVLTSTEAQTKLRRYYEPMPAETHGTIYHPAALRAFRLVFKPASK